MVTKTEINFRVLESQTNNPLSHLTEATLQDDVIANFHFQRLRFYWQRLSKTLQCAMDRLCTLTTSLKNQKHNIQSNTFQNIFLKLQIIRLADWSCTSTQWNSYFYGYTFEKTYRLDWEAFFQGCKKGGKFWNYPQEHLVVIRDEKSFSYCEFRNNSTSPLMFMRPP